MKVACWGGKEGARLGSDIQSVQFLLLTKIKRVVMIVQMEAVDGLMTHKFAFPPLMTHNLCIIAS